VELGPGVAGPLYAAGDGIYRSADGGLTWTTLTRAFTAEEVHVSPSNSQILYAAIGEKCAKGEAGMLQRSTDGGGTWQARSGEVSSLDINPADPNDLLGIACNGVYRSRDGGQTWDLLPGSAVTNYDGFALVRGVNDRSYIYALFVSEGGTPAIQRSTNAGLTWTELHPENQAGPSDLVVDPQDTRRLTFVSFAGFYRSIDAGQTWTARNSGLPRTEDFYHLSTLARDPATGNIYLASADLTRPRGVFRLTGNQPWTLVAPAPDGHAIHQLTFVAAPTGPALLAVTDAGMLYRLALGAGGTLPGMPRSGAGTGTEWLWGILLGAALVLLGGLRLRGQDA
jgi:photosystem II stability/assembly factor-like uncharacterized protein